MSRKPLMLVTGGGRGIGAAVARAAARAGYDLALTYVADPAAAERVAAACREAGASTLVWKCDLAIPADIQALFAALDQAAPGRLAALVNNGGVTGRMGKLAETDDATIAHTIAVNTTGLVLASREAVKRMSTAHGGAGGSIVNLSSVAAVLGSPGTYTWYAASKGAVDSFTTGLAREVAAEGIRVNAVRPGLIETEIHASGGDPDRLKRIGHTVPMGRVGSAEEVADAILYLCSPQASYVTGATIDVTGGR